MTSTISSALASLTRRSGPMTLTVFSPLTPDIASSTLSEIICEKLKIDAGEGVGSSRESSSVISSLVTPRAPLVDRLERREELDVVEARDVGAVVGAAELRDDRLDLRVPRCASRARRLAFGARAAEQDGAHAPDVLRRLLERDRRRQRGADPEVALLELGHELAPERPTQPSRLPTTGADRRARTASALAARARSANSGT